MSATRVTLVVIGSQLFWPKKAVGQSEELAQSQNSADVKHISHEYPLRAISGNWHTMAKLSGKTASFGLLAHLVARWV
jgi:hypothetical protein